MCIARAVANKGLSYPARASAHVHHTRAQLPIDVAKALAVNPLLVQKAVETFYTRDALQLRVSKLTGWFVSLAQRLPRPLTACLDSRQSHRQR